MGYKYYLKIGLLLSIPLGVLLFLFLEADSWQTFVLYFVIGLVMMGIGRVFGMICDGIGWLFKKIKSLFAKEAK
ncbi:hypothetical protein [Shewanella waksmanii]|uniref:hypothetical protein n=1 Tax=Shewanella waksmanii TaxID=213783 RepID=UPI00048AA71C|nr:hypothetical protein [Shewanella waksmanii]